MTEIFEGLKRNACFAAKNSIARRCVSRDVLEWERVSPLGLCEFRRVSQEIFCIINEILIHKASSKDWHTVAVALLNALARNSEEDVVQFDIDDLSSALWYVSGLSVLGKGYIWLYDSLQHSTIAKAQFSLEHRSPFKPARCAFYRSMQDRLVKVEWQMSSWTPIAGGFLLGTN